jgi:Flp pilus assembly pilin Flp
LRPITDRPKRFADDESGATMTEYALLLLLIVLVVIGVCKLLGQEVLPLFQVSQFLP